VATKREYVVDFHDPYQPQRTRRGWYSTLAVGHSESRPETPIAALMQCAPGEEPEPSLVELAPLRDLLNDTIERVLDDRERWVFDALFARRLSLRVLGDELGLSHTHVARLRDQIREKLATELLKYDEIRKRVVA
jgi:DNA-directed RNA polymerase specialized sigma subunit